MRFTKALVLGVAVALPAVVLGQTHSPQTHAAQTHAASTRPASMPTTEPAYERPAPPREPHLHSLYNLTVLGRFIQMHQNENYGAYPATLKSLSADGYVTKEDLEVLMTNPITGKKRPKGYKYLRPADALSKDYEKQKTTPLVVELKANGTVDPQGSCLFADGQVGETPAGVH